MEDVAARYISDWGPLGLLIVFAIYIIYNHIKSALDSKSNDNKEYKNITHDTDILITQMSSLKESIRTSVDTINLRIDGLKDNFNQKHEVLNKRLVNLEDKVKNQPSEFISSIEDYNIKSRNEHNAKLLKQIEIGPLLHRIMGRYLDIINCDHIVIGAFHNGTSSLGGIPYCKFDIISEKFNPKKTTYDVEFAPMYKNVDITLHNRLPSILIQNNFVHYYISEDSDNCELDDVDDVLYRRLLGRGISQIALHILRDSCGLPVGFVGCIKYDSSNMVCREISACAKEIEQMYNDKINNV